MNAQLIPKKCQQQLQQQNSPSTDPEMFDLQGLLKIWAINTYVLTATKKQKKLKVENLVLRITWQDVTVIHAKPEYSEDQLVRLPKAHVLFSTAFRNKTSSEQEYSFRTERSTRSVAEVEIQRGVVVSKEVSLKLGLPSQVLEANAGFKHELSLGTGSRQSVEEDLSWGVDTRISVPGEHTAFAEVKITEEELTSRFRLVTSLSGRIRAVFEDPNKNHLFVKYLEGDLASIVEEALQNRPGGGDGNSNVWIETQKNGDKLLILETVGRCKFRFGVHQEVEVYQKASAA